MTLDHAFLISRNQTRPQLTAKSALSLSAKAYAEKRDLDAIRLLNIAHEMFDSELPEDYQAPDWIEEPGDGLSVG